MGREALHICFAPPPAANALVLETARAVATMIIVIFIAVVLSIV